VRGEGGEKVNEIAPKDFHKIPSGQFVCYRLFSSASAKIRCRMTSEIYPVNCLDAIEVE
jgi:hypothetical protein